MKQYDRYKEIPAPWLSKIPTEWSCRKIRYAFNERSEKGYPSEPLLSATQSHGVIPQALYENRMVSASKDFHLLKLVEVGDFVISLRSFQGGIEYAYYRGIISPAYTIMSPRDVVNSGYFRYLAKSEDFIRLLQTCVTGIREGQNIDYKTLRRNIMPIPSKDEQEQIVRYLDWKISLINKFVKEKKREVALLKELKNAEINRTVTRGLNTDAPLKDSGVEWIGSVPKHWELICLKRIFNTRKAGVWGNEPLGNTNDIICMRIADFDYDRLRFKQNINYTIRNYNREVIKALLLNQGDILIEKSGGGDLTPVGRAVIYDLKINALYANFMDKLIVATPNLSLFVIYLLKALYNNGVVWNYIKKTTGIQNLDLTNLLSKESVFIPTPSEQEQIVDYIIAKEERINKAISDIEHEIDLVKEYKARLISDVVTGKVDVREIIVPDFQSESECIEAVEEEADEQTEIN